VATRGVVEPRGGKGPRSWMGNGLGQGCQGSGCDRDRCKRLRSLRDEAAREEAEEAAPRRHGCVDGGGGSGRKPGKGRNGNIRRAAVLMRV